MLLYSVAVKGDSIDVHMGRLGVPHQMGHPFDPDNTSHAFQAFAARVGLGRRHAHELRHVAASLMLAAGTPLSEVSHVLGHSSIRITGEVYAHLGHEALRDAVVIGWLECWTRVWAQTRSGAARVSFLPAVQCDWLSE